PQQVSINGPSLDLSANTGDTEQRLLPVHDTPLPILATFPSAAAAAGGASGGAAVGRNQELHDTWRRSSGSSARSEGLNLGAIDLHSGFVDFDEWIPDSPSSPPLSPVSPSRLSHRVQSRLSPPRRSNLHRGMPEIVRGALPGSLDDILGAYQHHHDDHAGTFHCPPDYHIDPLEYHLNQNDYHEYPLVEHNPSLLLHSDDVIDDARVHRPASPVIDYSLPGTADRGLDAVGRVRDPLRRPMQPRMRCTQPRRMRYHMQDNVRGVMFTPSTREKQHQQQPSRHAGRTSASAAAKRTTSPVAAAAAGPAGGYRTIRRVHARAAAAPATAGRAPSLLSVHNRRSAAPRFRGIHALFVRVSTRVRAALRSVATADAPSAAKQHPPLAADHTHHTINRRPVLRPSTVPSATLGRGAIMRPRGGASAGMRGLRRRPVRRSPRRSSRRPRPLRALRRGGGWSTWAHPSRSSAPSCLVAPPAAVRPVSSRRPRDAPPDCVAACRVQCAGQSQPAEACAPACNAVCAATC
ncbi:hypothetical protein PENTCL1PPCAC_30768, partial [Pristionchus entomophagus]